MIESFTIKSRKEFYRIGKLFEGKIQPSWFVLISFNSSLGMTIKISEIEPEVEITGDRNKYMLLVLKKPKTEQDDLFFDLLLGLNIGSEVVDITIKGSDLKVSASLASWRLKPPLQQPKSTA